VLGTKNQQIIALDSHELRKATNLRGRPAYLAINHLKFPLATSARDFPTKCSSSNRRRKTIEADFLAWMFPSEAYTKITLALCLLSRLWTKKRIRETAQGGEISYYSYGIMIMQSYG
jgi:hypothetical protein